MSATDDHGVTTTASTLNNLGSGTNRLVAADARDAKDEVAWEVKSPVAGAQTREVSARGRDYSVERHVEVTPTHVLVKDKITNLTDDVIGIILSNSIRAVCKDDGDLADSPNRTCFVHGPRQGVGMVPLDDVYRHQCEQFAESGMAGLRTDKFGLDKRASHIIEWALYPTASGDYYDLSNETAVLKHIPVTLHSGSPVNLVATQYDRRQIHLTLSGQGNARLEVRSGDFAVMPGHDYVVHAGAEQHIAASADGVLTISISLDGQTDCQIESRSPRTRQCVR